MNQPNAKQNVESPAAKIKWATINDYTRYDSRRCNNGGAYGFWTNYKFIGRDSYEVTYGTTADFDFCMFCNSFGCHCDKTPSYVTEDVVFAEIEKAEKDESDAVTAEYEFFDFANIAEWIEKLRRRVRDALNKTTDERAIIRCASTLNVSLE